MGRWCTVTVTDADGRRHSLDLVAESSYDAAHLFVAQARGERALMLPGVSRATLFEVVSHGKLYLVRGEKLKEWILARRKEWTGPKSYLFNKRPMLD